MSFQCVTQSAQCVTSVAPQFVASATVASFDYGSMFFYTFIGVVIAVVAFWMFIMFCMLGYCVFNIFVGKQSIHDIYTRMDTLCAFGMLFGNKLHVDSVPVIFEAGESKKTDCRLDSYMRKRSELGVKRCTLEELRVKLYDDKWKVITKPEYALANNNPKIQQELDDTRRSNTAAGEAEGMVFPRGERIKLLTEQIDAVSAQLDEIWRQITEIDAKIAECEK
jgi:hypothetical protein